MLRRALIVVLFPLWLSGIACNESPDAKPSAPATQAEKTSAEKPAGSPQITPPAAQRPAMQAGVLRFRVQASPRPTLPYRVESVGPEGVMRLAAFLPEQQAEYLLGMGMSLDRLLDLTEGYYLGLTGLPQGLEVWRGLSQGPVRGLKVLRVQVTEVQGGSKAVVQVGAEAAKELQPGAMLVLLRPAGSTTAELQAVPDILSVLDEKGQASDTDASTLAGLSQSTNHLKQIGLAMHNFHDVWKQFPPAVIYGPDGKPWHSWRVLILPFIEQQPLYQQYRFDEPWDGPNNRQLLDKVPPVYRDPIYKDARDCFTHYAVATGTGTAFPIEKQIPSESPRRDRPANISLGASRMASFTDGTSNSLLAGSVSPDRKIPWMKPEDVVVDENFPGIGKPSGFAAPFRIGDKAGGVFLRADGSVTTIRSDIEAQTLQDLLHIADGHPIGNVPSLNTAGASGPPRIPVIEIRTDSSGATARLVFENPESPAQRLPFGRVMPSVPLVPSKMAMVPPKKASYPTPLPALSKQEARPYSPPPAARTVTVDSDPFASPVSGPVSPPVATAPAVVAPSPVPMPSYEEVLAEVRTRGGRFLAKGFRSSWSPDGRRLVFGTKAGNPPGPLVTLELEGGKITEIANEGKDPAWSAKGAGLIAYVTGDGAEEQVWLIEPSGKNSRKVADGGFPSWSADGKTLFFQSRKTFQLMAVDPAAPEPSAAAKPLANVPWWYPAISPDGKRVAYRQGSQLVIAELPPGKGVKRYAPLPGAGFLGSWSPDGKQFGFGGYGSDLAMIILDCQTERGVEFAPQWLTLPAWSPDGLKVAFDVRGPAGFEIWMIAAKALAQGKPAALVRDPYTVLVPEGAPAELADLTALLKEAHAFRPATPEEKADREGRGRIVMRGAAQRILRLESDHSTPAAQLALLVLLEDRVRGMAATDSAQQRQVVDLLKMYLDAETEIDLARQAAELALKAGKTLEQRNPALAAEAYRSFVSPIAARKDAKLSETAKAMEEATRRLGSLPISVVLRERGDALGGIRYFGYPSVWYTACAPDGRLIAGGNYDGGVYLWDVATGKEVHHFLGHRNNVNSVAFSPDGRYLLSGGHDSTMRLWDAETGKEVRKFQGHTGWIFGVAFSPDGRVAVSSSADWSPKPDNSLRLWDVRSGAELKRFEGHTAPILSVAFLPDGRRILSGSDDASVRLWSVQTGKELRAYRKHATAVRCVAVSPDGRFALSGGIADYGKLEPAIQRGGERVVADPENCVICVWDLESGQLLRQLRGHEGGVHSVAFSRDGRLALSGSGGQHASIGFVPAEDNTVRLWDVQSGREIVRIVAPNCVDSVAMPPEGRFVVFAGANQPVTLVPLLEKIGGRSSGVPPSQPSVTPRGDFSPKLPTKPETKMEPARKKP